jgi:tetratricopeptide (TPR) repeat protein
MSCGYLTTSTDRYRDFHHRLLGTFLESKARLDEALREYQAAIAAKGSHPEATGALGNLLFRMGKTAEAKNR